MSDKKWIILLILLVVIYQLVHWPEEQTQTSNWPPPTPPSPPLPPKELKNLSPPQFDPLGQPRSDIRGYKNPGSLLRCPGKDEE